MRTFIKNELEKTRENQSIHIDCSHERKDGDIISMNGCILNGLADLEIVRTKANGHQCSRVTVSQMPLTDITIATVAELAVESL